MKISVVLKKLKKYGLLRTLRFVKTVITNKYWYVKFFETYSQYGEDITLQKLFKNKSKGFYVDIGAFSPNRLSNTKLFFLKGWRGINIDVNPKTIETFNVERPKDTNLNMGVSNIVSEMLFYKLKGMNSFIGENVLGEEGMGQIEEQITIKVDTLENILDRYLGENEVDFISIDTEGNDLNVLKSNNWVKYRPKVVLVESFSDSDRYMYSKQKKFMKTLGYKEIYNNGLNSFYLSTDGKHEKT